MENKFKLFESFSSSTISKLWYSEKDSQLIVEFKNGQQYRYNNVSISEWNNLKSSESKGKFLNENIKSKPFQKMILND